MYRYVALILFLSCGIVHGIHVNVTNKDGKMCIYADLMVNFSVSYETNENKSKIAVFQFTDKVLTNTSVCNDNTSTLNITFGEGHSWSLNFSRSGEKYKADSIIFSYNLKDNMNFPKASSNDTKTVVVKPRLIDIGMNTCYSCKSPQLNEADDKSVNQTLWNVTIQAFVANGTKSDNFTTCPADQPTPAPTSPPTTASPTTTAGPTPTLPTPTTGSYNVMSGVNGSVCLLASFGLRIGVKQGGKYEEINLEPNATTVSGFCGVNISSLTLVSSSMEIVFIFANDSKKFHLQALNANVTTSSGAVFSGGNTSLNLWQASLSSSYMCNNEQNFSIDSNLNVFTFNLRVQPFAVNGGVFSTAHECPQDDVSVLIPVVVAAALAGLIVIVVAAYIVGRRKTHAGYQTL